MFFWIYLFLPKQAIFPSSPIYFKSYLAASFSIGSFSDLSSMANISFCLNSALSSKFILASKQTTKEKNIKTYRHLEITVRQSFWNITVIADYYRMEGERGPQGLMMKLLHWFQHNKGKLFLNPILKKKVEQVSSHYTAICLCHGTIFYVCFKQSAPKLWTQVLWVGWVVCRNFIRQSTLNILESQQV